METLIPTTLIALVLLFVSGVAVTRTRRDERWRVYREIQARARWRKEAAAQRRREALAQGDEVAEYREAGRWCEANDFEAHATFVLDELEDAGGAE